MLRFAIDENFNDDIVRGLIRRQPDLDVVRVREVNLSGADEWEGQVRYLPLR